jgi:hypothetical protein
MSWDPRDRPESSTERRYCNKRALKGILEQKIKKIATPAKIQIQKFDQKEVNGQKNWEVGGLGLHSSQQNDNRGVMKKGTGIPRGFGVLGACVRIATTL